jgi:hypothetical protein
MSRSRPDQGPPPLDCWQVEPSYRYCLLPVWTVAKQTVHRKETEGRFFQRRAIKKVPAQRYEPRRPRSLAGSTEYGSGSLSSSSVGSPWLWPPGSRSPRRLRLPNQKGTATGGGQLHTSTRGNAPLHHLSNFLIEDCQPSRYIFPELITNRANWWRGPSHRACGLRAARQTIALFSCFSPTSSLCFLASQLSSPP